MNKRLDRGLYWDEALSLVKGCTPAKMSEELACKNCWLRSIDERFNVDRLINVETWPERLEIAKKKKPKVFAVWSDLFHEKISFDYINDCMQVLNDNPQHIYLILTKRPERLLEWSKSCKREYLLNYSLWFGTTVEVQETADIRIPLLIETKCRNRFLSIEPLLGQITINKYLEDNEIDWVICGCESGPKNRETDMKWVMNIWSECLENDVAFFLKQLKVNGKIVKLPEIQGRKWTDRPFLKDFGNE